MQKKDIQTRADIELLVRLFYDKVLTDEVISFIFTDIAKIELEHHFPKLFDFWENMLVQPNGYQTNVMQVHIDLDKKIKLQPAHFQRWVELFVETVDELFEGKIATMAKNRAMSIAMVMETKINQS